MNEISARLETGKLRIGAIAPITAILGVLAVVMFVVYGFSIEHAEPKVAHVLHGAMAATAAVYVALSAWLAVRATRLQPGTPGRTRFRFLAVAGIVWGVSVVALVVVLRWFVTFDPFGIARMVP